MRVELSIDEDLRIDVNNNIKGVKQFRLLC